MMPTHSRDDVLAVAARLRKAIDHAQVEHVRHRASVSDIPRRPASDASRHKADADSAFDTMLG